MGCVLEHVGVMQHIAQGLTSSSSEVRLGLPACSHMMYALMPHSSGAACGHSPPVPFATDYESSAAFERASWQVTLKFQKHDSQGACVLSTKTLFWIAVP